ncbi:MAG: hypothetical protein KAR47_14735 [Planctomycetes bacterium]|nr:hypothetical protein [Planctomycetota bacterium]
MRDKALVIDPAIDDVANRRFEICVIVLLLIFGIYKSVVMFGAIPVPNPDYAGFIRTGEAIWSGSLPGSFKRAPVVGVLQVGMSKFVGGPHPTLTASWLVNAILSALSVVLIWLVGKRLIGRAAIWLAVVTVLNPWIMRYQAVPIAETTMIFFSLLTFYFIFRRSNWAYVFAAIAPMVRYELVSLIVVAFLMDMVMRKTARERWLALCWSGLASVPFLLWMLGTWLNWETNSGSHYIHNYADAAKKGGIGVRGSGFKRFFYLLWESTFSSVVQLPSAVKGLFHGYTQEQYATQAAALEAYEATKSATAALFRFNKALVWFSVLAVTAYGIFKRHWKLLALLLFLLMYIAVHAMRIKSHARYSVPAIWAAMMFFWAGLYYCWRVINRNNRIPSAVITILQVGVIVVASVLTVRSLSVLPKAALRLPAASSLPYVIGVLVVAIFVLGRCFFRSKYLRWDLTFSALVFLMAMSQYYATVRVIGDGSYNIEFKRLADWYIARAEPGEKLACTWSSMLKLLADKYSDDLVGIAPYKGTTMREFIENCHKNGIVYVAWTHRGSGSKTRRGMGHILPVLIKRVDNEYMTYEHRIEISSRENNRWINIFKLRPEMPPDTSGAGGQTKQTEADS